MSAQAVLESDWSLFQDWCSARGLISLPTAPETLNQFLRAVPGHPSTDHRRLRAIRRAHLNARAVLPIELPTRASTLRSGDGWVPISRALAQLPTLRFPVGLRGRRDGWIIVLIGELGMTRREALAVTEADVHLHPDLRIAGLPVRRTEIATECPSCAVYRWLRVLGPSSVGRRDELHATLDPRGVDDSAHDCAIGLDGVWRQAEVLTPAIDRYGWVSRVTISRKSASTVMRERQAGAEEPTRGSARSPVAGRYQEATSAELAIAYDEVDALLADLLARTEEALRSGESLRDYQSELLEG